MDESEQLIELASFKEAIKKFATNLFEDKERHKDFILKLNDRAKEFYQQYKDNPTLGSRNIHELVLFGGDSEAHSLLYKYLYRLVYWFGYNHTENEERLRDAEKYIAEQYAATGKYDVKTGITQFRVAYEKLNKTDFTSLQIERIQTAKIPTAHLEPFYISQWASLNPCKSSNSIATNKVLNKMFATQRSLAMNSNVNTLFEAGRIAVTDRPNHTRTLIRCDKLRDKVFTKNEALFISLDMFCESSQGTRFSESYRTLTKVRPPLPTPYIVFECDLDPLTMNRFNRVMYFLSKHAPLVAIVYSGNKSHHYWFNTIGLTNEQVQVIHTMMQSCGADPATAKDCALVRTPNAGPAQHERKKRGKQELIYFDESQIGASAKNWNLESFEQELDVSSHIECVAANEPNTFFMKIYNEKNILGEDLSDGMDPHKWNRYNRLEVSAVLSKYAMSPDNIKTFVSNTLITRKVEIILDKAAGHSAGLQISPSNEGSQYDALIRMHGKPYVVKRDGKEEDCSAVIRLIKMMFGYDPEWIDIDIDGEDDMLFMDVPEEAEFQFHVLMSWMSHAAKCYYNEGLPQSKMDEIAQCLIIAGNVGSNKSNFLERVIGAFFSRGDVKAYLQGEDFNDEFLSSAMAFTDETDGAPTERERNAEEERMKALITNNSEQIKRKHKDKINIKTFKRFIRVLNTDKAGALPNVFNGSFVDKIILLHAPGMPVDKRLPQKQFKEEVLDHLEKQLPFFYSWLIYSYEPPEVFKDALIDKEYSRYPVVSYKNRKLSVMLMQHQRANKLLRYLESSKMAPNDFIAGEDVWRGDIDDFMVVLEGIGMSNIFQALHCNLSDSSIIASLLVAISNYYKVVHGGGVNVDKDDEGREVLTISSPRIIHSGLMQDAI
jgi:hypothetical protein